MHDATNLPYQAPSNADLQRAMWNDNYGMPCAKGGVSNQLCGWIRAIPLFTGKIGDSQMINESKIMEQQKTFSENDDSSEKSFANVFDKGFRNTHEAAMQGQTTVQPKVSKGDVQFTRDDVLHSACVAFSRSGNERAVQRCKMSWFIKRGCAYSVWDTNLVCDIWEAWAFQMNFMYGKVL